MLIDINVGIDKLIKKLNKNLFNLSRFIHTNTSFELFILKFYTFKFQVASLFVNLQKNGEKFVLLEQLFHDSIQQTNKFPDMKFKLNFYRDIHDNFPKIWCDNSGNLLISLF